MPGTNPYTYPEAGTAQFPVSLSDCSEPDLAAAANAIYDNDDTEWPVLDEGDLAAPIPATLSLYPDAVATVNYLGDQVFGLTGASVDDPGTVAAFVNPGDGSSPDAVQAINFLYEDYGV